METPTSELVNEYLQLPSPEELQARMVPSQTPLDALQQIKDVRDTLDMQRREIAAGLDYDSLQVLLNRLFTKNRIDEKLMLISHPDSAPSNFFPIEVVPAMEEWWSRIERGYAHAESEQSVKSEEELTAAKAEMGTRWRNGAIDAREWFRLVLDSQIKTAAVEALLRAWFDYVTVGDILNMDSESRAADHGDIDEKQLRKYYEGFAIGDKLPEFMQAKLDERFANRWPEGKQLEDWQKIISVKAWGAFWNKFGSSYLDEIKADSESRVELRSTRKTAGGEGLKNRERNKFIRFSQDFAAWLGTRKFTQSDIQAFSKQDGVSHAVGREFLGVMLNAKAGPDAYRAMWETLEGAKISLPQEDAEECFEIIHNKKVIQIESKSIK